GQGTGSHLGNEAGAIHRSARAVPSGPHARFPAEGMPSRRGGLRLAQLATEQITIDQAAALLTESDRWGGSVLARLESHLRPRPLRVLEIGAAQGRALIALHRRGHEAYGVEPWDTAIEIGRQLA